MDERDRHAAGMQIRREVLGHVHVDLTLARTTALTAEFQDLITRYAWGEIWTRPGLDVRSRRLLVIGTLLALGRFDEFRMHVSAAIAEGGLSVDEVKEVVLQQAIYCGVPAANRAFDVLREVVEQSPMPGEAS
jgi:4-carboxymuconolactone decarboxylase